MSCQDSPWAGNRTQWRPLQKQNLTDAGLRSQVPLLAAERVRKAGCGVPSTLVPVLMSGGPPAHLHLKSQEPAARSTLLGCQSRLRTVERMGFLMCLHTHLDTQTRRGEGDRSPQHPRPQCPRNSTFPWGPADPPAPHQDPWREGPGHYWPTGLSAGSGPWGAGSPPAGNSIPASL